MNFLCLHVSIRTVWWLFPHLNFSRGVHHSTLPSRCDAMRTTPSSLCCTLPSLSMLAWSVCYSHMNCSLGVRKQFILRAVRKRVGIVRDQRTVCRLEEPCSRNHWQCWQLEHGSHDPPHNCLRQLTILREKLYIQKWGSCCLLSLHFPLQITWLVFIASVGIDVYLLRFYWLREE